MTENVAKGIPSAVSQLAIILFVWIVDGAIDNEAVEMCHETRIDEPLFREPLDLSR